MAKKIYHHIDSSIPAFIANGILDDLNLKLEKINLVTNMDVYKSDCCLYEKIVAIKVNNPRFDKISILNPFFGLKDLSIPDALWPDYISFTSHYIMSDEDAEVEYCIHTSSERRRYLIAKLDLYSIPSTVQLVFSDYNSVNQVVIRGMGNFNQTYHQDFLTVSGKKYKDNLTFLCQSIALSVSRQDITLSTLTSNSHNAKQQQPATPYIKKRSRFSALEEPPYKQSRQGFFGLFEDDAWESGSSEYGTELTPVEIKQKQPNTQEEAGDSKDAVVIDSLNEMGAYSLSIHDPELLISEFMDKRQFKYQHDELSHSSQLHLYLEPVAILSSDDNKKNLGVFAREPIKKGVILGEYLGEIISVNETDETHYCFDIGKGKYINAADTGNWTALVNSPRSAIQANVEALKKKGRIFYKTIKPIDPSTQLLVDYGDDYPFPEDARYIKATDSHLESIDIVTHHDFLYLEPPIRLSPAQARALGLSETALFKIPSLPTLIDSSLLNSVNWDAVPLLEQDAHGRIFRQYQQENVLLLAYACVNNDEQCVRLLLGQCNADPNVQSSIQGRTAAHATVLSPLCVSDKKKMLTYLFQHQADFSLQDNDNKSIVNFAIDLQDEDEALELIRYLLEELPRDLTKEKAYRTKMLSTVTNDDDDVFLYSLKFGKIAVAILLSQYLTQEDIQSYLKDESFQRTIKQLCPFKQRAALCRALLKKCKSEELMIQQLACDVPSMAIQNSELNTEHYKYRLQINHEDQFKRIFSKDLTKLNLNEVLEAIREQTGVDITDSARLNKSHTCLKQAKKYQLMLESIGRAPTNATLKTQEKLMKLFDELNRATHSSYSFSWDLDSDSLASGQTDETNQTEDDFANGSQRYRFCS